MWDTQFWVAAIANGVLATGFLYLTYHLPGMYRDWLAHRETEQKLRGEEAELSRQHAIAQDERDQKARHSAVNAFQLALAETFKELRAEQAAERDAWRAELAEVRKESHLDRAVFQKAVEDFRAVADRICRYDRQRADAHQGAKP